jgi:integrase
MKTRKGRVPGYLLHRPTDRGYAKFGPGAKPTYFPGPYGSEGSRAAYARALAEYLSGARPAGVSPGERVTVRRLLAAWWVEAERRYQKFGRRTAELGAQRSALRFLRELYADTDAAAFGPVELAAVRQRMVDAGWVRTSINLHCSRIRTMFRWAASQRIVPESVHRELCTLAGLRKGKSAARESEPKRPPTVWQLRAVLSRCGPTVGAMVRLQYLSGMRPGEICALRPCDLDRSERQWRYVVRAEAAKTGCEVYWLGPRAQAVLIPWLDGVEPDGQVFPYTTASYRRHLHRCCRAAGCRTFGPHALRHAHGARVDDGYGEEAVMKRLNHTQLKTAKRYSRTATALARRIAEEVG